jgi:hypothetical protein
MPKNERKQKRLLYTFLLIARSKSAFLNFCSIQSAFLFRSIINANSTIRFIVPLPGNPTRELHCQPLSAFVSLCQPLSAFDNLNRCELLSQKNSNNSHQESPKITRKLSILECLRLL